jgi:hypothetical protein
LSREKAKDSKFTWQTVLDNFVNSSFFAAYLLFRALWRSASTLGFKARPVAACCGQLRWIAIFSAKMPAEWTALPWGLAALRPSSQNTAKQGGTRCDKPFSKKTAGGTGERRKPPIIAKCRSGRQLHWDCS